MLLVRPAPYDDESPLGYLLRLIDLNGLMSADHLFDAMATEHHRVPSIWAGATQSEYAADIASAIDKPIDAIKQLQYVNNEILTNPEYSFRGANVPRWGFRRKAAPICTTCLAEAPYARALWDMTLVEGCHQHGASLIDQCPHCSAPLKWARREVAACGGCGFDLRGAVQKKLGATEQLNLKSILDLLTAPGDTYTVYDRRFTKANCFHLLAFLWHFVNDDISSNALTLELPTDSSDTPEKMAQVLAIFHNPQKLETVITNHLGTMWRLMPALGMNAWALRLGERLKCRQFRAPEFNVVRDMVARIVNTAMPISLPVVEKATVLSDPQSFSPKQVAFIFGVHTGIVDSAEGMAFFSNESCVDHHKKLIDAVALNRLIATIHAVIEPTDEKTVSIGDLVNRGTLSRMGKTAWDLLAEIRARRIRISAWDKRRPFSTARVSRRSLDQFLGRRKQHDGYLSVVQVARRLGTYPDAIYRLVKAGKFKLQEQVLQHASKQLCATEDDVNRFNAEYALAGTLAKQFAVNATNFADKVRTAGIEPISGPGIDGGLVYVFRRAELAAVDLAAVAVNREYQARSGRRKASVDTPRRAFSHLDLVESREVGERLAISAQKLGQLVKAGWLNCVDHANQLGNTRVFERQLVDEYCTRYRENAAWMPIEKVSPLFAETQRAFERNWTHTGRLTTVTDGLKVYLHKLEVDAALRLNQDMLTSRQVQQLIGIDKATLANWHRLGRISPASGPGVDEYKNFLYARSAVLVMQTEWMKP
jgi:TniQ